MYAAAYCKEEERRIDDRYAVFNWAHNPRRTAQGYPRGNQYRNWLDEQGIPYQTAPFEVPEGARGVKPPHVGPEYWRTAPLVELGMPEEHHHTTWCADRAIDFIRDAQQSTAPWLFSVNFYDPHHPMDPPEAYLARYLDIIDKIPLPEFREEERAQHPLFHHDPIECQHHFRSMTPYEHRLVKAAYWAMIDLVDAQVGRLVNVLEETNQLDDTIIIFISDHGEILGDHGIYLKGPYFYEPTIKVPLIFSWPGIIKGGQRDGQVGITLSLGQAYPLSDSEADIQAVQRCDGYHNRWFADPVFGRGYPADMLDWYSDNAPEIQSGDLELIATPIDFLGINGYCPDFVRADPESPFGFHALTGDKDKLTAAGYESTDLGWPIVPEALTEILVRVRDTYAPPAIYITENGAAYDDKVTDDRIDDVKRIEYLDQHIDAVKQAIAQGVPVDGYFLWSFLDNFEWAAGMSVRFGIVYVDYATLTRIPKKSFEWYRSTIQRG